MNFAKNILHKYGWKDGDGLGKRKDGITKPLKATLKFDKSGFGADQAASDFNNHWWQRVFNDASNNLQINKNENGKVELRLKHEADKVEISTKSYSNKKLKKAKKNSNLHSNDYDNFIHTSTLAKGGGYEIENNKKIDCHEIAVTEVNVLTDEALFEACGGRTAHKGARHGLKLSGKLSRLEKQEQEFLAKMKSKYCVQGYVSEKKHEDANESQSVLECEQKKKKKCMVNNGKEEITYERAKRKKTKNKKRKLQMDEGANDDYILYNRKEK